MTGRSLRGPRFVTGRERRETESPFYARKPLSQAEAELTKHVTAPTRRATIQQSEPQTVPAYLPRIEVMVTPEDTACPCCKGPMHVIGEERSERVDVIQAQHRVLVTRRSADTVRNNVPWYAKRRASRWRGPCRCGWTVASEVWRASRP